MNRKLNKLFSATLVLMMVLSQSSNLIATLYASSELLSEQTDVASSEAVSEQLFTETTESEVQEISTVSEVEQEEQTVSIDKYTAQLQESTEKQTRATYTDMSGVGNQNKSRIGQETYIYPNEETEDKLKDISEMQAINNSKYIATDNFEDNLVELATTGVSVNEGIVYTQYPNNMTEEEVNNKMKYFGSCWSENTINKKIVESDECYATITDYGYVYNLEMGEYKKVDLIINIDYLDFTFNSSEKTDTRLLIKLTKSGVFFGENDVDELEFTYDFRLKDGTQVNVPLVYRHSDFDLTASLGLENKELYKVATYYQDANNPTDASSAVYDTPYINEAGTHYYGKRLFNYMPFYDYVKNNYDKGLVSKYYFERNTSTKNYDRKNLNSFTSLTNADGIYEPNERGWNRLKFIDEEEYLTVFDSWGTNTGNRQGVSDAILYSLMLTDGRDGLFAVNMNSSTTMTLNLNSLFFGYNPQVEYGQSQDSFINPYTITDTIITKNMSDENSNQVAEIGEELTYSIQLDNVQELNPSTDIPVRDSLLEDLPDYLTWDGTITAQDRDGNDVAYSGDITKGTMVVSSVAPQGNVVITYKLKLNKYVEGLDKILNVAVNKDVDPKDYCTPTTTNIYCGATEIPVEGNTVIKKTATDSDGSGKVSPGEKVTYKIEVTNNTNKIAYDVDVRDNRLESIPSYVTFNNDIVVSGATSTGNLLDGTLNFAQIGANQKVTITYSFTFADDLKNITGLTNVATDNGDDPSTISPPTCDDTDCSSTTINVEPADTFIKKSVKDEDGDGVAIVGETLTYTIAITNPTTNHAYDVVVRDSMLENVPSFVTFNNDVAISGSTFTGSLTAGTLKLDKVLAKGTVNVTYSITVNDVPKGSGELLNIATDNGQDPDNVDPETCDDKDCSNTETEVEEPDTHIKKSVVDSDGDGLVIVGETLQYSIQVSNPTKSDAVNVVVRDSMLEKLPSYVTFNDDIIITADSTYSGNLKDGTLKFDQIAAGKSVTITYSITFDDTPRNLTELLNVATDTGVDPNTVDPETCDDTDCSNTVTEIDPADTHIKKSVQDEDGDNLVIVGETLTYTLEISNPTGNHAYDVVVRDNMLENLPEFVSFNDDVKVEGSEFAGSLTEGTLVLDKVMANETVVITYSIVFEDTPRDLTQVLNIATDNGEDPDTVDPETCDDTDCSNTVTEIDPADTHIKKSVVDSNEDGLVTVGETLTYTLEISNPTGNHAYDIAVRDSMLENIPTFVTFGEDIEIVGSEFTGSLLDGTLVLDKVLANDSVFITYTYTFDDTPRDMTELLNVATDNGEDPDTVDPETCDDTDCSEVITEIDPADTHINKSVVDSDEDGLVIVGETLTYTLEITNITGNHAYDVAVRDNLLENIPTFVTFGEDIEIVGSEFTGSLLDGTLVLDKVLANDSVFITYSFTFDDTPKDMSELLNIATDNGEDPDTVDPETCDDTDCSEVITEIDPADTHIKKSVVDSDEDGLVTVGETLTYTLEITNITGNHAYDVAVRDSMLENIPTFVTFNDDIEIVGSEFVGSLLDGTLTLDKILANETVVITYSFTYDETPKDMNELLNIATDNGEDPTTVDPETCDDADCSGTTTEVDRAGTIIEKSVVDSDGSGLLARGETLTYTIIISNPTGNHAYDVAVRDDMLEKVPSFASFNKDVKITGSTFTGSLTEGTLLLDAVKAGETVEIVYSLTINELPTNTSEVINVATDNGDDPSKIDSKTCGKSTDCATASIALIEIVNIVSTGSQVMAIAFSSIIILSVLLVAKRQVNEKL